MSRKVRGRAALKSAACTVEYEFHMLLVGCAALNNAPTTAERNLALEALLIHARNLRDFFAPSGRNDDVLARDFVSQMPRIAMPYLRSRTARNRLNRLLSHMSYSRPRLGRSWDINQLAQEVEKAMRAFLTRLMEERPRRVAWFGAIRSILETDF